MVDCAYKLKTSIEFFLCQLVIQEAVFVANARNAGCWAHWSYP